MEDLKLKTSEANREKSLLDIMKSNISEYFMFIALIVIMIFFSVTTDGVFISSRNISNLINQMGYIAVLAVGMTLIIVIRHIELSVGYLAGFLGAFAAIAMTFWGWPIYAVIPAVMIMGILAGMLTATPVAKLGVPAFVSTMAAGLIFRGALLLVTMGTGTIVIRDTVFNAIGNGYIPDLPLGEFLPGRHKLTLIIGLIGIVFQSFQPSRAGEPSFLTISRFPVLAFSSRNLYWFQD